MGQSFLASLLHSADVCCHSMGRGAAGLLQPISGGATNQVDGRVRMENQFTQCLKCNTGILLPLSDYGRDGAPIHYKAWVCNSPDCGFNLRIDNGEISMGRNIAESYK